MSTAIIVRDQLAFSIAPTAYEMREQALAMSALVSIVRDPETNEAATRAQSALRTVINEVEKARKKAKEPILDAGRQLDAVAKEFVQDIEDEYARVARASADYQQAQIERQREIERRRAEEAARIERERLEELRKAEEARRAAEAEARRKADEEARAARNEQERIAAEARAKAEQERLAKEAEEAKRIAEERAKQQQEALPSAAPVRAKNQIVREDWEIIVTDIYRLANARPGYVRIEPNLVEIRAGIAAGDTKIPGVRLEKKVTVGALAARGKVVDV